MANCYSMNIFLINVNNWNVGAIYMSTIQERLGLLVRKQRKSKGLSTQDLAKKLGVSSGLINNIENSKNDVFELELFMNLIKELNISIDNVFVEAFKVNKLNMHNTLEIIVPDEIYKDINMINKYLSSLVITLLESSMKFDDTEEYLKVACFHMVEEVKTFNEIKSIK